METDLGAAAKTEGEMNWISRIGGMLVSPRATLQYIVRHPDWLTPFLFLLVLQIAALLTFLRISGLQIFLTPLTLFVGVGIAWILRSGIIWCLGRITGGKADFYPIFSTMGYAYLPIFIKGMLAYILMIFRAPSLLVTNLGTMLARIGLLKPQYARNVGLGYRILSGVASSIDVFGLWSLGLMFLAIQSAFGIGTRKAIFIIFLYWMLTQIYFIAFILIAS